MVQCRVHYMDMVRSTVLGGCGPTVLDDGSSTKDDELHAPV